MPRIATAPLDAGRAKPVYRPDIDGLRAVAVLSVLLYHADVPGFPGGFVGVDVFFVISGYLICGMIDAQLREGSFSLGDFYKRRIMRIVPALAVTMLVTSALAYLLFLPIELKDYAYSLLAAAASVSNMYFAYTAGYFDAPALTKPLLHTWSLGVEEQFYVFAPLLMMLVARFVPRAMRPVLVVAALGSFALAAVAAILSPTKAFYFAPFRAWEFLLGALLAVGAVPIPASARIRDAMSLAGLGLILGAVLFASAATPFVLVTGVASLGAVLLIASTSPALGPSIGGRLLSLPPIVFLGLVSYSIYLWHWPVIVFLRTGAFGPDPMPLASFAVVAVALSIVLGVLSWHFVERPFRSATPVTSRRSVFATFAAASAVLGGLGAVTVKLEGLPSRFSPDIVRLGSYLDYDRAGMFRQGRCYLVDKRDALDEGLCLHLAGDRPNVLLMGDSFAAHLWHGLSRSMPGVNLLQASVGQCRPVIADAPLLGRDPCSRLRARMFGGFLTDRKVDRVLLAAAWKDEDVPLLLSTIDALHARGLAVTVLGPLVEYERPLPRLLADAALRDDAPLVRRLRDESVPLRDDAMEASVTARGARYVSLYDTACPDDACPELMADDVPFQFDTGHLTAEGSVALGRRLVAAHGPVLGASADPARTGMRSATGLSN